MKRSKLIDTMWRRHANPWSVWTRLLSTPLIYLPLWNRSWKQGLAVATWFATNPFLFPEPCNSRTWAARAIRGDRRWTKELPLDAALAIQVAAASTALGGLYAAYKHRLWLTAASAITVFICNVWFLNRMTTFGEEKQQNG